MDRPDLLPELLLRDAAAWRDWLAANHAQQDGSWLVLAKKGTTEPTSLSYDQALEEALCVGWIDGRLGARDAATYRQRFTPRRARSRWSQRNVGLASRLIEEGRMRPAGLAEVERARADGRWDAAYRQAGAEVPPDLAAALHAEPRALQAFRELSAQNRFAILFRLGDVKRAETRARRIEQYVAMLARGETLYPQRGAKSDGR